MRKKKGTAAHVAITCNSTKFSTSASKYFNGTWESTCLKQSTSNCYGCTLGTRTLGTGTCLSAWWLHRHVRPRQRADMAVKPLGSQPASRIPRRAVRGELRTVESQNSLRNRGLSGYCTNGPLFFELPCTRTLRNILHVAVYCTFEQDEIFFSGFDLSTLEVRSVRRSHSGLSGTGRESSWKSKAASG